MVSWGKWSLALLITVLIAPSMPMPAAAADSESTYDMLFPVQGDYYFTDTWGEARANGRTHQGTDIMTYGVKGVPVIAVASGTVGWMHDEQGGKCCAMALHHDDGWTTWYIHLNNDTPGTDDGQGWGFAPGIETGVHVEAGEVIGYVGDSGNAESTAPHLHFELHEPDGTSQGNPINPYTHLLAAEEDQTPIGWLDDVSDQVESARVRGWVMDPDTSEPIYTHIYVDGKFHTGLLANLSRPDVERAHDNGKLHGFDTILSLSPGTHEVCVYAINHPTKTGNPRIGCETVTITSVDGEPSPQPDSETPTDIHTPFGWVDEVAIEEGRLLLRGWAIDEDAPDQAVGIHVYLDGSFIFGGRAEVKRGDVDKAFGLGSYHGFEFDVAIETGSHEICIYAINLPDKADNPLLGCEIAG